MDPNAALDELRTLAQQHITELDDESLNNHVDTGRMAELVMALDGWLLMGNALPREWAVSRR